MQLPRRRDAGDASLAKRAPRVLKTTEDAREHLRTSARRFRLRSRFWFATGALAFWSGALSSDLGRDALTLPYVALLLPVSVACGAVLASVVATMIRRRWVRRHRALWSKLTARQRSAAIGIFSPLQTAEPDTRRLAVPLLRLLEEQGRELVPATPDGRGDEPIPV